MKRLTVSAALLGAVAGAGCEAVQIRSLMPELAPDSVGFYCGSNLITFPTSEESGYSSVLTFRRSDIRSMYRNPLTGSDPADSLPALAIVDTGGGGEIVYSLDDATYRKVLLCLD